MPIANPIPGFSGLIFCFEDNDIGISTGPMSHPTSGESVGEPIPRVAFRFPYKLVLNR
jgi:hypothetical protein